MEERCAFLEEETPRIEAAIAYTEEQLGVYVSAAETERLTTLAAELRATVSRAHRRVGRVDDATGRAGYAQLICHYPELPLATNCTLVLRSTYASMSLTPPWCQPRCRRAPRSRNVFPIE